MADGGISTGCLAPCHGFGGIVEQWKTSTHYIGTITNSEELGSWTGPGTCGNCHAADGLPSRVSGRVNAPADAGPVNVTKGELNYRTASGGATEATFAGQSKVASIGCVTCHDVSAQNDPHKTGSNYQPGAFPLRVASGPTDNAVIEKSADAGIVTGTSAGNWGVSNTCIFCHKSRKDVSNYISRVANTSITSVNWGPHEAPQADIFSGLGGYEFGKVYSNSEHQKLGGCATCHMGASASNGGAPDHSFRPSLTTCTSKCHTTATNFNVKSGQTNLRFALAELQGLLNGLNALTRGAVGNPALAGSELTDGHYELDRPRPGASLTPDQTGALYNYFLLSRGSAWGVHNPSYSSQLVYDSIDAINGPGKPVSIADPRAPAP